MGTVVGIIDGTGSLGAALGQMAIGVTEQMYGWNAVFKLMSGMVFLSAIPLLKSVRREIGEILTLRKL